MVRPFSIRLHFPSTLPDCNIDFPLQFVVVVEEKKVIPGLLSPLKEGKYEKVYVCGFFDDGRDPFGDPRIGTGC
jgi:hypothetical protein